MRLLSNPVWQIHQTAGKMPASRLPWWEWRIELRCDFLFWPALGLYALLALVVPILWLWVAWRVLAYTAARPPGASSSIKAKAPGPKLVPAL